MEVEKRKGCSFSTGILAVFTAVTFTVALLEGAGLVVFWTHFQSSEMALQSQIQGLNNKVLELSGESSQGVCVCVHIHRI
jgi:hypothetical protein